MMNKSLKKWIMIIMAFTFFFAVSVPADSVDARRGGGGSFRSGTKGFTNTPKKSPTTDNVKKSTNTNHSNTNGTQPAKRGFFSGGGFMKGLMIGGLAGMLFGGMFANMGFLGNVFGLLINLLVIYVLISIVIAAVRAFKNRRKPDSRDGRY